VSLTSSASFWKIDMDINTYFQSTLLIVFIEIINCFYFFVL